MSAAVEAAWAGVEAEAARLKQKRILDLYTDDPARVSAFTLEAAGLIFDFSKEKFDAGALHAMLALAKATDLEGWRAKLFAGDTINTTEGRAVQHPALRWRFAEPAMAQGEDVTAEIAETRARLRAFAHDFRTGALKGATGQTLDTIVHIGIGGSDLGPRLVADALKNFRVPGLSLRFAANVDGAEIEDALEGLDPARTLVIVVSKTFTTQETKANADAARAWLRAGLGREDVSAHLVAVSAAPSVAGQWGVPETRVFPFRNWVGGRYSLWSAVSLSVECVLAAGAFDALLDGAAAMDAHFRGTPLAANIPVLGALIQSFNRCALGTRSQVCAPYARRLQLLPSFLQQLEMESNGKGVTRDGRPLARLAAGVTWGEPGTNGQHSFYQLLHQGLSIIPVEILVLIDGADGPAAHRDLLLANALAQAEALLVGKSGARVRAELEKQALSAAEVEALVPHKTFSGDRPTTLIGLSRLAPETLGALIAFYEHRTFVQGVLMEVNSFDQWGVELGKQLAGPIGAALGGKPAGAHDPSTAAWIARLRR